MIRSYQKIDRRKTRVITVGNLNIGGNNPILVQTMTNTLTSDVKETLNQINTTKITLLLLAKHQLKMKSKTTYLKL